MRHRNRYAKVNVKLIVILVLVAAALAISLVGARQTRRNILSERALKAGEAAFAEGDWATAAQNYQKHLSRNPDNVEVLRKYAEACLSTQPLGAPAIRGAISAYVRIVELEPDDSAAYEKLAMLYGGVRNFSELASLARTRIERDPNDRKATLWLATALIGQDKTAEARQTLQTFIDNLQTRPEKCPEFVQACVRMAQLASRETPSALVATESDVESSAPQTPLDWLNKAVQYAPDSAEALAHRARLRRALASVASISEQERATLLELARKDLEAADRLGTDDPRVRFFLGAEWMAYGELDRATAEMETLDALGQEKLRDHFLDINDWIVARFRLASDLAARKGQVAEAAALADEVLAALTEKGRRVQVLPFVIPHYVAAGRVADAQQSLDEFRDLLPDQEPSAETTRTLAALQALVAGAENKPHVVIDALEPIIQNEPAGSRLWRLLAEAYDRTGQAGRAVKALEQYRRLSPDDPQMMRELAKQYSKLGDWQQAFETAKRAEALAPEDDNLIVKLLRIGAGLNLAMARADDAGAGEIGKLSAELADLGQAHPDEVGVRILQAIVAAHQGQPEEAERLLKLASEQCTEPLKAEMQLGRYYLSAERTPEAVSVYETACQRHPEAADPWLALADVRVASADYDAARDCLKQGLDSVTDGSAKRSISMRLALLELAYGGRATGINLLKELAAQDNREIQARSLLLRTSEVQQDPATAEKLIGELRQAEGESGVWWRLHQASLWLASGDWASHQADIADSLLYCIEADPAWPAPILLLAGLYGRLGDLQGVEDTYRRGLLGNPSATDIAAGLLALLERQGRYAEAEKVLEQIRVNPQVASTWQIRMALGAGDYSRAIDELKVRASDNEQDAGARIELGRLVYQQTKDADQALEYLKGAEAVDADSRTLAAVRASILREEGRTAEALQVLNDYVADHNDFSSYWMRAVYYAEEGELERAEQDYQKLITFTESSAVGYGLLGDFYARTNRLDLGIATTEEGLREHADNLGLKRTLMRLLLARAGAEDRDRALEILSELEAQLPQDAELATLRATEMLKDPAPQSFASIRGRLEDVVKRQPTAVGTHLALVSIAMRQGEFQAACNYAIAALEANPGDPTLLSARSRAELMLGYTSMAVKLAHEALGQDPNNLEAVRVIADAALNTEQRDLLEEAATLLDSALARYPTNDRLQISHARVLVALGQLEAAILQLEAYCQTQAGQDSIRALVTLADLHRLAGAAEPSLHYIEQAERLSPNNQAVIHARFLWLVWQNQLEELTQVSAKYLSATEQDPVKLIGAGAILLSLDSMELKKEGIKLFEQAVALAPTSLEARLGLASSLYQTADIERAEKVYQELLEPHPDDIRVLNDLAWILQEHRQQYAEALELAERGLRLAPEDPHLLDTRGTILSNMPDRLDDARSDFETLVRLLSSDRTQLAKALLQLGRICAKLGDLAQAQQHLEKAMEIDRELNVFTPSERSEATEIVKKASGENR